MTRISATLLAIFLVCGHLLAQEDTTPKPAASPKPVASSSSTHFEIDLEKGLPAVLSGPEIRDLKNAVIRFGWNPKKQFTIMATYAKMSGRFAKDDILNQRFSEIYNRQHHALRFRDAFLDERDVDIQHYMLGIAKFIPISPRWESYVGVNVGVSSAQTEVTWTGVTHQDGSPATASLKRDDTNAFLTSVRGGLRFSITRWLAAQASFEVIPIGSLFDEDNSYYSLNGGVVVRF